MARKAQQAPAPRFGIGPELRRLREERKLTMREVYEPLNLTHSGLSNLERGNFVPGAKLVMHLAELYQATYEEKAALFEQLRADILANTASRLELQHAELLNGAEKTRGKTVPPPLAPPPQTDFNFYVAAQQPMPSAGRRRR